MPDFFNILDTPAGGGGSDDYILIRDEKPSGTDGGAFTPINSFLTRDLNTTVEDTGNNVVSLASNQIELVAGTYRCRFSAPANDVAIHFLRLRNVTDGATLVTSPIGRSNVNDNDYPIGVGRFTIAAAKKIELQHICQTEELLIIGMGFENTQAGFIEIYGTVEFWKEQ